MNKHIQKQQALDLRRAGLSFDAIAKEIGAAKSTVHRWINEEKENNGTPETPVGTGFGTIAEQNETNYETNLQNETVYEPVVPKKHDECSSERSKLPDNENYAEELQHEPRMSEQRFLQKQSRLKKDIQIQTDEAKRYRQKRRLNRTKTKRLHQEGLETNDQPISIIPDVFLSRLCRLLRQYLKFDDEECTFEILEELEEKVNDLNTEINDWAYDHDFDIENDDGTVIIDNFISDIEESVENFSNEGFEHLYLSFDVSWKDSMLDWLESIEQ